MAQHLRRLRLGTLLAACVGTVVGAQTPVPFPGAPPPPTTRQTPAPPPAATTSMPVPQAPAAAATVEDQTEAAPTEAQLGFPIYPAAKFLRSYDAGRGQRYYVFGVGSPFTEMVTYYRNVLREKGTLVFEVPPTHVFEIGRFREETMAFPPSVTVKDYTFSGSAGYPNPRPGQQPERFQTLIQIVPAPAAAPQR
ncbi:MAG TPA: hypothetical protein VMW48_18935 [Vicinamibacterales bacterium]|nr:hypothetical protein [Vicinamibacterales bacterium]